ncbi:MAG: glycosyltransferase [Phycisphaerae bacterium]|nr:glycosyltransferase [Phycisphaerae bacterium]MDW8261175.1 glycosyltransferase [Phycisphaerales bacterium]
MFSRPIHVCHLGKYYPPAAGGIESHVQTLARAQAEAGARVRVVCVNHIGRDGHDVTYTRYGQSKTVEDADGPVRVTRLGRSACLARFDVIPGLPRLLLDLQYSPVDIVHLHTPNPTMLLTLAGLRISKPIVVTHHSDVIHQRFLVHVMRPLERIVYGRAAAILASSEAYADTSGVLQRYRQKLAIVPLGCNLRPFAHPSPEARASEEELRRRFGDAPLWLCVGRCVYYKGLGTAIAALRRVPGRLMIIGQGPLREKLRSEASRLGVADRVIWQDHVSDAELVGAYRAATALWFPSNARSEAFGLVQVEAMACGCPVINTALVGSGVSWVSRDGESGLTVAPDDPEALARAARRLVDSPSLREALSEGARSRAAAEFSAERMAHRSLEVYARLLQRSATAGRIVDSVEPAPARLQSWIRNIPSGDEDAIDTRLHDPAAV